MPAYSRTEWNDLLRDINTSITNKPSGCSSVDLLTLLPANTVWARSHVQAAIDALKASCPEVTFETLKPLWDKATVDEIRSKIAQMWCDCADEDCPAVEADSHYATVYYGAWPYIIQCEDDPEVSPVTIDFSAQVVEANKHNYQWHFEGYHIAPGEGIPGDNDPGWVRPGNVDGTGRVLPAAINYTSSSTAGGVGCDGKPHTFVEDPETETTSEIVVYPIQLVYPVCTWPCPDGTSEEEECIESVDGWSVAWRLRISRSASGSPCCVGL